MEVILNNIEDDYLEHGLISFFYLKTEENLELVLSKCKTLLVDSGAHSFQHGVKIDFDEYTREYMEFIKKHTDNPKIEGFFEMDIDNVTGYEKVKEYRVLLEAVSDKIIPVWHQDRGIDDFHLMCSERSGRRISITGFSNNDIIDGQYNLFLNTAHNYGCNVHILGMTRFPLIKELNLHKDDSVDSSSWKQTGIYGGLDIINGKDTLSQFNIFNGIKIHWTAMFGFNLVNAQAVQHRYKEFDNSIYYK